MGKNHPKVDDYTVSRVRALESLLLEKGLLAPDAEYATWMYHEVRTDVDGTLRSRVPAVGQWRLTLQGGLPRRKILDETWTPSGVDPEVREFTLPP